MAISFKNILKQSAKYNFVNLLSKFISFPIGIIVAMVLYPKDYGIISLVGIWGMYAGLLNPGFIAAASREIPYLIGKEEKDKAVRVQNIAVTADLLYSLLPFLVVIGLSFFSSDKVIKICLVLTAFSFIISNMKSYLGNMNHIREKFGLVARGKLIYTVVNSMLVLLLIFWLKVYAVLLAPIVGSLIVWFYYMKKGPIQYKFIFDSKELLRLVKVGVVLSSLTVIFYSFRMADRLVIASFLPLADLGLYAFALGQIVMIINLFEEFIRVMIPILYRQTGQVENPNNVFREIKSISIYFALATAIFITFSQTGFFLLVNLLTTKYIASIPVFNVLSFNIYLFTLMNLPLIVLNSPVVNRQNTSLIIFSLGLLLNIILNYLFIKMGYGVFGIALGTVIIQGMVTITVFIKARKFIFIFISIKDSLSTLFLLVLPLATALMLSIFNVAIEQKVPGLFLSVFISFVVQIITWSIIIFIGYRKFFPKENLISSKEEIKRLIKEKIAVFQFT